MSKAEQIIRAALPRAKLRSISELADRTGISRATMSRKIKKPKDFTARELRLIASMILLTADELMEIIKTT